MQPRSVWAGAFSVPHVSPWGLLEAAGTIVAGATLLGFLGPFWWFFDLFSHFRVQYFLTLLLVALALASGRQWKAAITFGILAALNLATIAPLYVGRSGETITSPDSYRAMLVNVNSENDRYADMERAILRYNPHVLVLLEVNDDWLTALLGLHGSYPHAITSPRDDNFGMAVFSRFPFTHSEIFELGGVAVPSLSVQMDLNDRPVTILGTHTLPPGGADSSGLRNAQLAAIPAFLKNHPSPTLMILGDLNLTPWSTHFQRLLEQTGLRKCSQGQGVHPTWPTFLPLFLIPIDHCLHSPDIIILDEQVGRGVGSDHYPLIVDFTLEPDAP